MWWDLLNLRIYIFLGIKDNSSFEEGGWILEGDVVEVVTIPDGLVGGHEESVVSNWQSSVICWVHPGELDG